MKKILFCGGGSGGHVMPNIAVAQCLRDKAEMHYLISEGGIEGRLLSSYGYITLHAYAPPKFKRQFALSNLALPFTFVRAVRRAGSIIDAVKPDVVFTKGGYVGLPAVIAAAKRGIACVGHESDATLGLAHRLVLRRYTAFFSTFPLPQARRRTITQVGALMRSSVVKGNHRVGLSTVGFDGRRPILLIMGGSLGARALNEKTYALRQALTEHYDCFMLCGRNKGGFAENEHFHIAEYCDNIADVYACASVALTRGGASSLAELSACQVPFVAVPLTRASRAEQVANCKYYVAKGAGRMLKEESLNEFTLTETLSDLTRNATAYKQAQGLLPKNGASIIAQYLLEV